MEDGKEATYLETSFRVSDNNEIAFRLKNDNEVGKPAKVWRYAHFDSQATFESKRAVLVATLKKLDKMASNEQELVHSAMQKLNEFIQLNVP